jgi:hypothetical protein
MAKRLALFCVALLGVALSLASRAAPGALAAAPKWAFFQSGVSTREGTLRRALEEVFPLSRPVKVRCRGLRPVLLAKGRRGFFEIRCSTSLNIDDYLYHLDSRGRVYATRLHKSAADS